MISASRSSATSTFRCQSASAPATTSTATSVATKDLRAVSLINGFSPVRSAANGGERFRTRQARFRLSRRTPVRPLECRSNGGRRARSPRRPGAQPQGHHRPVAPEHADLHHRAVRLREVEPCLRHDLRRGAAPLRRVALRLRAAVPADDGEARRRLDRRALAGDLDRPEDDLAEPALDRRHGHRDLRLPAPALRARRPAALPGLRPPDRRPVDRGDRRPGAAPPGGDEVHGQRAGRPRPQGRVQGRARAPARRGLHAREGRRRAAAARGRDRRSTRSSSTRSRWSSTGW